MGRFTLLLEGKPECTAFLPPNWCRPADERILSEGKPVLHLAEDPALAGVRFDDGWSTRSADSDREAVYAIRNKAVFRLRYAWPVECVVASVARCAGNNMKLAAHYGMMTALARDCIGLHGVTLLCGNEIVILSAPSGTGKTTLAHLLEAYAGAIVINGDFALLSVSEEGVIFEPTPFCGTSGRCLNHRVRVNRVVFLGQSAENHWAELSGREAVRRLMSNVFVPEWDKDLQQMIQNNIVACAERLRANAYSFAPTEAAAEAFCRHIATE